MKALIFTDLHFHTWKSFGIDKKTLLSKRLTDQISVADQIVEIAEENNVDVVINGGDTCHLRGMIPVEVVNLIDSLYRRLRKIVDTILTASGNHDSVSDTEYKEIQDAVRHLEEIDTGRMKSVVIKEDVKIRVVDYNEQVNENELKGYDILVLHKQPTMVNDAGFKFEGVNWKTLAKNNKWVFFGHYHKPVKLSDNCYVLGSAMQLEFGDDKVHGVYIVDTEKNKLEFIPLQYPKFITVVHPSQVPPDDDINYYKITNATEKMDKDNVISIVIPKFFEERIKSSNFEDILIDWLKFNQRDINTKGILDDLVDKKQMDSLMNIFRGRLTYIRIKDFMSISVLELNIVNGFTLVMGKNELGGSNGAGKSSIFDALLWCLEGKTTKGLTGDDVIRRGCKNCSVTIQFSNTTIVERSRKDGLSIIIDKKDIVEGMKQDRCQQVLEKDILGFDMQTFMAACYFSQESLQLFTDLSDGDRIGMISHLLGFELYDLLADKVKNKLDVLADKHVEIGENVKDSAHKIELNEAQLKGIDDNIAIFKRHISEAKSDIENANKKVADLKKQTNVTTNYDSLIKTATELETATEITIKNAKENGARFVSAVMNLKMKVTELKTKQRGIDDINDELTRKINDVQNAIAGERCDECGSFITEESKNGYIDEKTNLIVENSGVVAEYITEIKKLSDEIFQVNVNIEMIDNQLENENKILTITRNDIRTLSTSKNKQTEIKATIGGYERDIVIKNKNIAYDNERINNAQKDIALYRGNAEELRKIIDTGEKERKRLEKDIESLVFWKKAFSNQGIKAVLLDKFCNEFNEIANTYVSTISNGTMQIILNPTKTLKSGEERNKIGIDITFNGIQVKYESLSGGEKKRVDIALCLSLNSWISRRYGISHGLLGIIILDEIFAFLDSLAEETIGTLLFHEGDNKAIYVVSHTNELAAYAQHQITIEKKNGESKLYESS